MRRTEILNTMLILPTYGLVLLVLLKVIIG